MATFWHLKRGRSVYPSLGVSARLPSPSIILLEGFADESWRWCDGLAATPRRRVRKSTDAKEVAQLRQQGFKLSDITSKDYRFRKAYDTRSLEAQACLSSSRVHSLSFCDISQSQKKRYIVASLHRRVDVFSSIGAIFEAL